jgi:hypothetical protein
MASSSNDLIKEFRHNKRLRGTCPECGATFRLADVVMYSIADSPPEAAAEAIRTLRQNLKERREQLNLLRKRMTQPLVKTLHRNWKSAVGVSFSCDA